MRDPSFWHTQLDDSAQGRTDQRSFHVFAESTHSDARGQIYKLAMGERLPLWTAQWPRHLFVVLVITGEVEAVLPAENVRMRALSQLVVLPGAVCELRATTKAAVEIISFLAQDPRPDSP